MQFGNHFPFCEFFLSSAVCERDFTFKLSDLLSANKKKKKHEDNPNKY